MTTTSSPPSISDPASRLDRDLPPQPVLRLATTGPAGREQVELAVAWPSTPPLLADVLPVLDSLGVRVARHTADGSTDRFVLAGSAPLGPAQSALVTDAFGAILAGRAERDALNRLVLDRGLHWRDVALLRALCRYARQAGVPLSLEVFHRALLAHGACVDALLDYFRVRLDPEAVEAAADDQSAHDEAARARVLALLEEVTALDEDRALRAVIDVVGATVRTSHFQRDADGRPLPRLTLKVEPGRLPFVAPPVPLVETYVYTPHVEGLHLRTGRVARGGIRHSSRTDDYRTEVLGLMKAQAVKNSLIVPAGAKGAFVVRSAGDGCGDHGAGDVACCYSQFIRGLLDVTDNRTGDAVVTPPGVRARDDADSYLVVAADKGTARFSDVANRIAAEYSFWLGDAFASGGSSGYDHKEMGITARGAWVSVEAHLDELGVDPAHDDLTVVGIGDMSGDVFGNGMLMSDRIRLVAAFDHRHVFLDPDPDPATSFRERQRLHALARSSWADYDRDLVSPGGGTYSRSAKRIPVSPELRRALGLPHGPEWMTPNELISAILSAPVTLLWNGGIGTYVKASTETAADAGDKVNDHVRVDADRLRCRIVGEGGNLGLTQQARIEYAAAGGRINADFVDNSAGVDTSDREVNLKILLEPAVASGRLEPAARDGLLASMSDDVAAAVLRDNQLQALAISLAESHGPLGLDRHARLIRFLERGAGLDRRIEHLPDEDEIGLRRRAGLGLTRPEIAVVLAWSKISVRAALLDSPLPADPALRPTVEGYFPEPVRDADLIGQHSLRREIAATVLANDVVNQAGPGFFLRLEERTGARLPDAAAAFVVARSVFGLDELWADVSSSAYRSTEARLQALTIMQGLLERGCSWLLRNRRRPLDVAAEIHRLRPAVARLRDAMDGAITATQRRAMADTTRALSSLGMPEDLAGRVAACGPLHAALDIAEGAEASSIDLHGFAGCYHAVGEALGLEWLRAQLAECAGDPHWTLMAKASLADDLLLQQRRLASAAARSVAPGGTPEQAVARWLDLNADHAQRHQKLMDELRLAGVVDVAMATIAVQQLRELAQTSLHP